MCLKGPFSYVMLLLHLSPINTTAGSVLSSMSTLEYNKCKNVVYHIS